MLRKRKALWISIAVVVVLLGTTGGGYALAKTKLAPVSSNGTISAAYQKNDGTLRLVNGEGDVLPSEQFIQWNQTGPQGPAGVGIINAVDNGDGTFTLNFSNGTSFTTPDLTGPQGDQGPQGNLGPQGNTGPTGVGIAGVVNNGDGTFTLDFTDNSTFTTPDLTGPQGDQGPQGARGPTGVGIAGVTDNGDGTFTFGFTDNSTFTTPDLTGAQGDMGPAGVGIAGVTDNGDGTFTFKFTDNTSFTTPDLTGPQGEQGPAGVGIARVVDNGDGTFTLDFSDNTSFTTPDLTGPRGDTGPAGVGISGVVDNGDGTFTLDFSDNSTFTTPDLTGPRGEQGPAGVGITGAVNNDDGTFTLDFTDNSTFTTANLTGPQGKRGVAGKSVLSGDGPPLAGQGYNGYFYIDTSAYEIYGPKTSAGWGTGTSLIGPQGPAGSTSSMTPLQIATLHWYNASEVASVKVEYQPVGICFDGADVWVLQNGITAFGGAASTGGFLTEFNAATGAAVRTISIALTPTALSFDGTSLWVTGSDAMATGRIAQINAATGNMVGHPYLVGFASTGNDPVAVAFDGFHYWTANEGDNSVTELNGGVTNYRVNAKPDAICFDGSDIWVATKGNSSHDGGVFEIDPTTHDVVEKYSASGFSASAVCFDGTSIWVAGQTSGLVSSGSSSANGVVIKFDLATGQHTSFDLGTNPSALCFDGTHIWVTDVAVNKVFELDAGTGQTVGSYATGNDPQSICFDGAFVWVACNGDGTINKY